MPRQRGSHWLWVKEAGIGTGEDQAARLGVDAAADAPEEGDGGAAEAEAGDGLVQAGPVTAVEGAEADDGGEQHRHAERRQQETHDRAGAECCGHRKTEFR